MKNFISCSHDPKSIGSIDGITYYCADKEGALIFDGDVVINLTGLSTRPQLSHIPELAAHVETSCEEIVIYWPDYGVPMLKNSFWRALHSYIKSMKWDRVCIHCAGGHGRTGTAASAMLIAMLGWSATRAVNHMRRTICKEMVETQDQCEYLCRLDEELNEHKTSEEEMPTGSVFMRNKE